MSEHRQQLISVTKQLKETLEPTQSNGSFNTYILEMYKAQTGATTFKTFKQWKDEGYLIIKGSKGFPVYSRPISKIKEERGLQPNEQEGKYFGTAILFNEHQVMKK
jgi:hypothetical protein